MDVFSQALGDFARRLGLPSLAPGASGAVDLNIERVGRLGLELAGERALVTLARPWPPHAAQAARAALAATHWREHHPWPVHAGAKGAEWLAFTATVPLPEFDVPALERLLPYLSNMLDAVEKAG